MNTSIDNQQPPFGSLAIEFTRPDGTKTSKFVMESMDVTRRLRNTGDHHHAGGSAVAQIIDPAGRVKAGYSFAARLDKSIGLEKFVVTSTDEPTTLTKDSYPTQEIYFKRQE